TGRLVYLMGQGQLLDAHFHALAPSVAGYAAFYLAIGAKGERWVSLQRNNTQAIEASVGLVKLRDGDRVQAIGVVGDSLVLIEAGPHPQISWLDKAGTVRATLSIPMQPITAAFHGSVLGVLMSDDVQWRLLTVDLSAKRLLGDAALPQGATKVA